MKLEVPCRGRVTELSGESGTIETSGGPVRFGVAACSGFTPTVGLEVWVMALRELPIVGARATLVNLTGEADSESIEDRVRRDRARALAANLVDWRIDDAAQWLAEHPDEYAADRFSEPGSALAMMSELRAAGVVRVALVGSGPRDRNAPNSMELELPFARSARASIFAILEREWERCNEDFSASPDGRKDPQEITREEAVAMGHPEAEGELAHDVGAPVDAGQTILTLWWD
jgi:hypothetical protein